MNKRVVHIHSCSSLSSFFFFFFLHVRYKWQSLYDCERVLKSLEKVGLFTSFHLKQSCMYIWLHFFRRFLLCIAHCCCNLITWKCDKNKFMTNYSWKWSYLCETLSFFYWAFVFKQYFAASNDGNNNKCWTLDELRWNDKKIAVISNDYCFGLCWMGILTRKTVKLS